MEEFITRLYNRGKCTVPQQLRDCFGVEEGVYVRSILLEVLKKGEDGVWMRRKVE